MHMSHRDCDRGVMTLLMYRLWIKLWSKGHHTFKLYERPLRHRVLSPKVSECRSFRSVDSFGCQKFVAKPSGKLADQRPLVIDNNLTVQPSDSLHWTCWAQVDQTNVCVTRWRAACVSLPTLGCEKKLCFARWVKHCRRWVDCIVMVWSDDQITYASLHWTAAGQTRTRQTTILCFSHWKSMLDTLVATKLCVGSPPSKMSDWTQSIIRSRPEHVLCWRVCFACLISRRSSVPAASVSNADSVLIFIM